jgi:hypothetical protein
VIIEPRELLVEVHAKNLNWQPAILNSADDPIEMPEFGLQCRLADLYRGTRSIRSGCSRQRTPAAKRIPGSFQLLFCISLHGLVRPHY